MNKIIKGEFESNLNNIFLKESPNSILIVTEKTHLKIVMLKFFSIKFLLNTI